MELFVSLNKTKNSHYLLILQRILFLEINIFFSNLILIDIVNIMCSFISLFYVCFYITILLESSKVLILFQSIP